MVVNVVVGEEVLWVVIKIKIDVGILVGVVMFGIIGIGGLFNLFVVIMEISDVYGIGNYVYEFIELIVFVI